MREWAAFFAIEPWGGLVDDRRAGILASLIANVHRDSARKPKPFEPGDFFPALRTEDDDENEADQLIAKVEALTAMSGAMWTGDLSTVPDWALSEADLVKRQAGDL